MLIISKCNKYNLRWQTAQIINLQCLVLTWDFFMRSLSWYPRRFLISLPIVLFNRILYFCAVWSNKPGNWTTERVGSHRFKAAHVGMTHINQKLILSSFMMKSGHLWEHSVICEQNTILDTAKTPKLYLWISHWKLQSVFANLRNQ